MGLIGSDAYRASLECRPHINKLLQERFFSSSISSSRDYKLAREELYSHFHHRSSEHCFENKDHHEQRIQYGSDDQFLIFWEASLNPDGIEPRPAKNPAGFRGRLKTVHRQGSVATVTLPEGGLSPIEKKHPQGISNTLSDC